MPKPLYGSPATRLGSPEEDKTVELIKQLQPAAPPASNPLGAAAGTRQLESAKPTTPLIDYSKVPDLNKIATANNQAIRNANSGANVAGQNGRPDTGSLNMESPAMSREAANDSYANFEDFFNKNTGYAAKYRSQIANAMGPAPKTENVLPGSVARTGVAADTGATAVRGFGGTSTATAPTTPAGPPDAGNPFTRSGGTQFNSPSSSSTKQALNDSPSSPNKPLTPDEQRAAAGAVHTVTAPPTTPKSTTPGTPITDIQKTADEQFSGFTNSNGKKSVPLPNTPAATKAAQTPSEQLQAELANLPTGATPAELAEVRRLSQAEDRTVAMGLDGGKALLSELNKQPVDAMDAQFMQTAGGRNDLDKYKQQFEGSTAKAEKALSDKYGAVQKRRDELMAELAARKTVSDVAPQPTTPTGSGPSGPPLGSSGSHLQQKYKTWDDFMKGDGNVMGDNTVKTALHQVGTDLSLADSALVEWGKNGGNVPLPMQIFRDLFASGFVGDVSELNNRVAFDHVISEFGDNAGRWLWDNLTPQDWEELKGSQNYGYSIFLMQKKMKAAFGEDGFNKLKTKRWTIGQDGKLTPVEKKIDTTATATAGTMSDGDIELTLAKGNAYKDPGTGRVFKSLDEWYKFKREGK